MKKILTVSLAFGLSHGCLFADAVLVQKAPVPQNLGEQTKQQLQPTKAKALDCPEMDLLNSMFETPTGAVGIFRMNLAKKSAEDVNKKLASIGNDHEAVAEQIRVVLSPVKEFFTTIQHYAFMIKPLVEKSLLDKTIKPLDQQAATLNKAPGILPVIDPNKPLILRFMEATEGVDEFFEKNVATKEQLEAACKEFLKFFNDINNSLTDEAIASYKELLAGLRSNKKEQPNNKTSQPNNKK